MMIYPPEHQWDRRWLTLAKAYASFSKDPSTKVGAVAVRDKRELSAGWNGFPRGVLDDDRLLDREVKYGITVHAEQNCIYNAAYVGVSLKDADMYVHGLPVCSDCIKGVIQVGIRRVVIGVSGIVTDRWNDSWAVSRDRMNEVGLKWEVYDASSL